MAELIDREKYRAKMVAAVKDGYLDEDTVEAMINILDCETTVDAAPVVHGKWTNRQKHLLCEYKECSVCGNITEDYIIKRLDNGSLDTTDPNYCPNCGAKMDGGRRK